MDSRVVVAVVMLSLGALSWALGACFQRVQSGWRRVGLIAVGAGLVGGGLTGLQEALGWNGWIVGAVIFVVFVITTRTIRRDAASDTSSQAAGTTSRS